MKAEVLDCPYFVGGTCLYITTKNINCSGKLLTAGWYDKHYQVTKITYHCQEDCQDFGTEQDILLMKELHKRLGLGESLEDEI